MATAAEPTKEAESSSTKQNQEPKKQTQEPKKRRRGNDSPTSSKTKRKKPASASTTGTGTGAGKSTSSKADTPPAHTLIIDSGGYTLKYGWISDEEPRYLPNVTARLAHQITMLVGDELGRVQNPNSLLAVTRSVERGLICNMGNQTQVWKRLLDILGVSIPLQTEAATAFGWKVSAGRSAKQSTLPAKTISSHTIAVVLLIPPHYPRLLIDQMVYVWMEDFGVARVGFGNSTVCAAQEHPAYRTSCTVDIGWSTSLIVPTFRRQAILPEAIRRLPMGGRHLINILKYYMSYRQYNLMDQEHLLKDVLERLGFVSLNFDQDLKAARLKQPGRRLYDRDYVLPDYQTVHEGQIRIPPALQKDLEREANKALQEEEEEDEEDEDFEAEDDDGTSKSESEDDIDKDDPAASGEKGNAQAMDEGSNDSNDDNDKEETIEQRRQELLQQRAEEERKRREQQAEEQVLLVSMERFAIPEILFRPSDAGFPSDLVGLAPAIIQSIQGCPSHFHPALYQSIHLVGGLSKIPNLKARLEKEVRELAPTEYDVKIEVDESPIDRAWLGGKQWVSNSPFIDWSISREEWESAGKRRAYGRLLMANGGTCV